METKEKEGLGTKIFAYTIGGIGLLMLIYSIISSEINKNDLKKNAKYTIGITKTKVATAKAGFSVYFNFKYKNNIYEGRTNYGSDYIIIPDGRYFVIFSSKNPKNCELLYFKPVPKSMKEAPPEGWDQIPLGADFPP